MKFIKLLTIFGVGTALVFATAAEQKKAGKPGEKKPAKAAVKVAGDKDKGQELYKAYCALCHYADKTDKRVGPGLKGVYRHEMMSDGMPVSDANMRKIIKEGRGKMAGLKDKLNDKQVDDLIAYLRTL